MNPQPPGKGQLTVDEIARGPQEQTEQLYRSSWVDWLTAWVDRQPGSNWLYYFGLGVALALITMVVPWMEGVPISRGIAFPPLYLAAAVATMLGLIDYLDQRALVALQNMRPVLEIDEHEYKEMAFRLGNLPRRSALVAALAAVAFVLLTEVIGGAYQLEALEPYPVSATTLRVFYLLSWTVFGTFLFHTVHQLRAINRVYTSYTRIDLFNARPMYGFSNLAAVTAGSLALISYGWMPVNPWIDQSDPLIFSIYFVLSLIAAVTFVLPQLGVHRLLVDEKDRLLDEVNLRFKAATAELHRKMDSGELEGVMDLNMAMASLQMELTAIKQTPTWPWEPEVVRLLVTAIALPLGLWLVQLILQSTLGL